MFKGSLLPSLLTLEGADVLVLYLRCYIPDSVLGVCFSVKCLGQDVEFDCIGSFSNCLATVLVERH